MASVEPHSRLEVLVTEHIRPCSHLEVLVTEHIRPCSHLEVLFTYYIKPCSHLEVLVADELYDDQLWSCGQMLVVFPAGAQKPQYLQTSRVAVQLTVAGRRQTGALGGTQTRQERRPG